MEQISLTDWSRRIESLLPEERLLASYFERLWPICRSITGDGFRDSLRILSEVLPYDVSEIPTGTKVYDWTVPREWNIQGAYLEDESGKRIIDFANNNLHVLGYSVPVDRRLTLDQLQPHLHSLADLPDAIPYLTSYYQERWGFCLTDRQRRALTPGRYHAVIKSSLKPGHMTLGEKLLPATVKGSDREILLSTYLCHPSLANNELSGPLVSAFVYRAMQQLERRFDYRFAIGPETIGAVAFLSKRGGALKRRMHAGFVVTCVGDDRRITYQKTRRGDAEVDRVMAAELAACGRPFETIDFRPNGSDERQFCSPGFDLPVGSLMRSMYGTYAEYHTSLDDKNFVSWKGMRESIALYLRILLALEFNKTYVAKIAHGEPMYGPRGLYPTLGSQRQTTVFMDRLMWIVNQSDGRNDLCAIARKAGCSVLDLEPIARILVEKGVLVEKGTTAREPGRVRTAPRKMAKRGASR